MTTRGDHTLNVRMLRSRGSAEREEPAMLALDLCARQRSRDAIEVATAALHRTPSDPDVLMALGRAYFADGQHERAQEALVLAARADRRWPEPYVWLFRALAAEGRAEKAAQFAVRALALGAQEPELQSYVRDRGLAARFARWRADPRSEEPTLLAMGLLEAKWLEEAKEVLESALPSDPEDEDLRALAVRAGVAVPLIAKAPLHDTLVDAVAPVMALTPVRPKPIAKLRPAAPAPASGRESRLERLRAYRTIRSGSIAAP